MSDVNCNYVLWLALFPDKNQGLNHSIMQSTSNVCVAVHEGRNVRYAGKKYMQNLILNIQRKERGVWEQFKV
jgi:hypothetical protein